MKLSVFLFAVIGATATFAQDSAQTTVQAQPTAQTEAAQAQPTLADAQKAYVAGNWKDAAKAYETACPNEPEEKRTECYLWNVLALSQTGAARDFSKAGKRLDSLIAKTSPQNKIYADLMMTKAQFQIYLGKYEKSAESLIHAIETAQPHQVTVLQKVCVAVQAKTKNDMLDSACKSLNEPRMTLEAATVKETVQPNDQAAAQAAAQTSVQAAVKADSQTTAPTANQAAAQTTSQEAVQTAAPPKAETAPTDTASAKAAATVKPEETVPVAAKAPTAEPKSAQPAAVQPAATEPAAAKEYWTLQLGAFGVKSNADLLVSNLKKRGISAKIEERAGETMTLYIVQCGNFGTKDAAIDFGANKLTPMGLEFRAILKK